MFMTNEDLLYLLQTLYPGTNNGVEYLTAHDLCPERIQRDHAYIFWWKMAAEEPTNEFLQAKWKELGMDILSKREVHEIRYQRGLALDKADKLLNIALDSGDQEFEKKVRAYRQVLRDIPQQDGFPEVLNWPEAPVQSK